MVFIYITCKDRKEAKKISDSLLKKRLVACTNRFPIDSSYWWQGKIVDDREYIIFAKTVKKNYQKIAKHVKEIHSYSVPCICLIKAKANKEYDDWLREQVR
jgi:periplasmic divalent cation tolerance protein